MLTDAFLKASCQLAAMVSGFSLSSTVAVATCRERIRSNATAHNSHDHGLLINSLAASATLTLPAGVWLHRSRLLIVHSSVAEHLNTPRGSLPTYRIVQIPGATSVVRLDDDAGLM